MLIYLNSRSLLSIRCISFFFQQESYRFFSTQFLASIVYPSKTFFHIVLVLESLATSFFDCFCCGNMCEWTFLYIPNLLQLICRISLISFFRSSVTSSFWMFLILFLPASFWTRFMLTRLHLPAAFFQAQLLQPLQSNLHPHNKKPVPKNWLSLSADTSTEVHCSLNKYGKQRGQSECKYQSTPEPAKEDNAEMIAVARASCRSPWDEFRFSDTY